MSSSESRRQQVRSSPLSMPEQADSSQQSSLDATCVSRADHGTDGVVVVVVPTDDAFIGNSRQEDSPLSESTLPSYSRCLLPARPRSRPSAFAATTNDGSSLLPSTERLLSNVTRSNVRSSSSSSSAPSATTTTTRTAATASAVTESSTSTTTTTTTTTASSSPTPTPSSSASTLAPSCKSSKPDEVDTTNRPLGQRFMVNESNSDVRSKRSCNSLVPPSSIVVPADTVSRPSASSSTTTNGRRSLPTSRDLRLLVDRKDRSSAAAATATASRCSSPEGPFGNGRRSLPSFLGSAVRATAEGNLAVRPDSVVPCVDFEPSVGRPVPAFSPIPGKPTSAMMPVKRSAVTLATDNADSSSSSTSTSRPSPAKQARVSPTASSPWSSTSLPVVARSSAASSSSSPITSGNNNNINNINNTTTTSLFISCNDGSNDTQYSRRRRARQLRGQQQDNCVTPTISTATTSSSASSSSVSSSSVSVRQRSRFEVRQHDEQSLRSAFHFDRFSSQPSSSLSSSMMTMLQGNGAGTSTTSATIAAQPRPTFASQPQIYHRGRVDDTVDHKHAAKRSRRPRSIEIERNIRTVAAAGSGMSGNGVLYDDDTRSSFPWSIADPVSTPPPPPASPCLSEASSGALSVERHITGGFTRNVVAPVKPVPVLAIGRFSPDDHHDDDQPVNHNDSNSSSGSRSHRVSLQPPLSTTHATTTNATSPRPLPTTTTTTTTLLDNARRRMIADSRPVSAASIVDRRSRALLQDPLAKRVDDSSLTEDELSKWRALPNDRCPETAANEKSFLEEHGFTPYVAYADAESSTDHRSHPMTVVSSRVTRARYSMPVSAAPFDAQTFQRHFERTGHTLTVDYTRSYARLFALDVDCSCRRLDRRHRHHQHRHRHHHHHHRHHQRSRHLADNDELSGDPETSSVVSMSSLSSSSSSVSMFSSSLAGNNHNNNNNNSNNNDHGYSDSESVRSSSRCSTSTVVTAASAAYAAPPFRHMDEETMRELALHVSKVLREHSSCLPTDRHGSSLQREIRYEVWRNGCGFHLYTDVPVSLPSHIQIARFIAARFAQHPCVLEVPDEMPLPFSAKHSGQPYTFAFASHSRPDILRPIVAPFVELFDSIHAHAISLDAEPVVHVHDSIGTTSDYDVSFYRRPSTGNGNGNGNGGNIRNSPQCYLVPSVSASAVRVSCTDRRYAQFAHYLRHRIRYLDTLRRTTVTAAAVESPQQPPSSRSTIANNRGNAAAVTTSARTTTINASNDNHNPDDVDDDDNDDDNAHHRDDERMLGYLMAAAAATTTATDRPLSAAAANSRSLGSQDFDDNHRVIATTAAAAAAHRHDDDDHVAVRRNSHDDVDSPVSHVTYAAGYDDEVDVDVHALENHQLRERVQDFFRSFNRLFFEHEDSVTCGGFLELATASSEGSLMLQPYVVAMHKCLSPISMDDMRVVLRAVLAARTCDDRTIARFVAFYDEHTLNAYTETGESMLKHLAVLRRHGITPFMDLNQQVDRLMCATLGSQNAAAFKASLQRKMKPEEKVELRQRAIEAYAQALCELHVVLHNKTSLVYYVFDGDGYVMHGEVKPKHLPQTIFAWIGSSRGSTESVVMQVGTTVPQITENELFTMSHFMFATTVGVFNSLTSMYTAKTRFLRYTCYRYAAVWPPERPRTIYAEQNHDVLRLLMHHEVYVRTLIEQPGQLFTHFLLAPAILQLDSVGFIEEAWISQLLSILDRFPEWDQALFLMDYYPIDPAYVFVLMHLYHRYGGFRSVTSYRRMVHQVLQYEAGTRETWAKKLGPVYRSASYDADAPTYLEALLSLRGDGVPWSDSLDDDNDSSNNDNERGITHEFAFLSWLVALLLTKTTHHEPFVYALYRPSRDMPRREHPEYRDFVPTVDSRTSRLNKERAARIVFGEEARLRDGKFLDTLFSMGMSTFFDPSNTIELLSVLSYMFVPYNRHKKIFLFHGYGNNGKSFLCNLIQDMTMPKTGRFQHLDTAMERSSVTLKNAVTILNEVERVDSSKIKTVTGNDPESTKIFYSQVYEMCRSQSLIYGATNKIVKFRGETLADVATVNRFHVVKLHGKQIRADRPMSCLLQLLVREELLPNAVQLSEWQMVHYANILVYLTYLLRRDETLYPTINVENEGNVEYRDRVYRTNNRLYDFLRSIDLIEVENFSISAERLLHLVTVNIRDQKRPPYFRTLEGFCTEFAAYYGVQLEPGVVVPNLQELHLVRHITRNTQVEACPGSVITTEDLQRQTLMYLSDAVVDNAITYLQTRYPHHFDRRKRCFVDLRFRNPPLECDPIAVPFGTDRLKQLQQAATDVRHDDHSSPPRRCHRPLGGRRARPPPDGRRCNDNGDNEQDDDDDDDDETSQEQLRQRHGESDETMRNHQQQQQEKRSPFHHRVQPLATATTTMSSTTAASSYAPMPSFSAVDRSVLADRTI